MITAVERGRAPAWLFGLAGAVVIAGALAAGVLASPASSTRSRIGRERLSADLSCSALRMPSSLLLSDMSPTPTVRVNVGQRLVVRVPAWRGADATPIGDRHPLVLQQGCSELTAGGGRRAVFLARSPGRVFLGATITPATNLLMPSWGGYVVIERSGSTSELSVVSVPHLIGLSRSDARSQSRALGLELSLKILTTCIEQGQPDAVLSQNPPAGTRVDAGSTISATWSSVVCH